MSKIAIISRPDQGVLIDVSGCSTMQEMLEQLSSTLQVSTQFWKGLAVDLNIGSLALTANQMAQIMALAKGVGIVPRQVFADSVETLEALRARGIAIGEGVPMSLPVSSNFVESSSIDAVGSSQSDADDGNIDVSENEPFASEEVDTTADRIIMYEPDEVLATDQNETISSSSDGKAENCPTEAGQNADKTLYLRQTLRSGQTISHKGDLIIIGDVNAGAEVLAQGDITVWGSLRGIAHAGVGGNVGAEIRALRLQPIQLRIANYIARSPDRPRQRYMHGGIPETARLMDGKIRIMRNTFD